MSVSPADDPRHRILVVGTGSIGERHVRCLLNTKRASVGICEVDDAARRTVADRYGLSDSFADLDSALRQRWDAAVVATPAHTHVPIALRLAEARTNLLIEKPLAVSTAQVSALIEKVKALDLVAAVAYVYRAHPVLAAMRQALISGRFGQPLQLVTVAGQHFPTYRPAYRRIYYADRATGGGAIQDALTHLINACEWLVGPVTKLAADAAHLSLPGVTVEDTVHLIARHGRVMATYALNQHQAPNEVTMTVVCERATLCWELHEQRWRWMTDPGGAWHDQCHGPMDRDEWFAIQDGAFLDAVERKAAVLCSLEEAFHTLKAQLAALRSADSGAGLLDVDA